MYPRVAEVQEEVAARSEALARRAKPLSRVIPARARAYAMADDAVFQEYEETCLFTIARFSASESLRVYPNIYKNSPPFASREGFPLVGIAMSVRERESASDSIILSLLA